MPTTEGILFIVAATALFFFWIYGIVSFYFDLRYQFVPVVAKWLRKRRANRPRPERFL
ncbi:hypothetical protein [Natrinema salifodinae]|uniref:Uncharacterized protein n=1 Tax=Natrinema salifodinae TaxID=1202768 RepID=A0A1I0QVX4_9EURY|nr:hypothetical protein [Natrinema salifodinae]SEW31631.1 hypothetical protein SAMN05216285_4026 [Natrinema salifodinae]